MNRQQIKYTITKHYRQLKKYAKKIAKDFDEEDIHQFRITYKKLRAFLRMVVFQNTNNSNPVLSKKLKKTYQICGSIRDLQLQQQRIKQASKQQQKILKPYLHLLQTKLTTLKTELSDIPVKRMIVNKNTAILPDKFTVHQCITYTQQQWSIVCEIIQSGNYTDANLHTIRKCLKDVLYNFKYCKEVQKKKLLNLMSTGKEEAYFNDLTKKMGTFVDSCNSIVLLNPEWLVSLDSPCRKLLQQKKREWVKEKAVNKKLLVKQFKTELLQ